MKRQIKYTIDEVYASTRIRYKIRFTSLKNKPTLLKELTHILSREIIVSDTLLYDKLILCDDENFKDVYTLQIPEHDYLTLKDCMGELFTYLKSSVMSDRFFLLSVGVSYSRLDLMNPIQYIDPALLKLSFSEKGVIDIMGSTSISPRSISASTIIISDDANRFGGCYDSEYSGICVKDKHMGFVEFNYINNISKDFTLEEVLNYYIISLYQILNRDTDLYELEQFKKLKELTVKYDNVDDMSFNAPGMVFMVDLQDTKEILDLHYIRVINTILNLVYNGVRRCDINYDTDLSRTQLYGATIKGGYYKDLDFSNCKIENAFLENCNLHNCKIINTNVKDCIYMGCDTLLDSLSINSKQLSPMDTLTVSNSLMSVDDKDSLAGSVKKSIIINYNIPAYTTVDSESRIYKIKR